MCFLQINAEKSGGYDTIGIILRLFLLDIPFFAVFSFEIFAVVKITKIMRAEQRVIYRNSDFANLILYPIVLFISWFCVVLSRLAEGFNLNIDLLSKINLPFASLNGFFNALIYGYI